MGFFTDTNFVLHGFLRASDGTITTLDAPGAGTQAATGTQATDINANGVIAGTLLVSGATHSFFRDATGAYTVFDPPQAGSKGSSATGINTSGAIAGTYTDANSVMHGYIRNPDGSFVTIDDPNAPQTANSLGTDVNHINAGGAVVGVYFDLNRARHGFVRE